MKPWWMVAGVVLLAGCVPGGSDAPRPAGSPPAARLQVLVVGDPAMADAIGRLSGEWKAETGGELRVRSMSERDFSALRSIPADALIGPSPQLGELVAKDRLLPVPEELSQGSSSGWADIFGLLKSKEAAWKGRHWAIPFGSPVLVCYCRADLLERLHEKPPQTWADVHRLADVLADRQRLGDAAPPPDAPWSGMVAPLAARWAGIVLLARAAPYASHRENYSTLFDVTTMAPLVDGPPFVRALEELAADAKLGAAEQLDYDPAAVRAAFWQGRCGLALTWPSAAEKIPQPWDKRVRVLTVELPGAVEVYQVNDRAWEKRRPDEDPHVPLLGAGGRLGMVVKQSPSPEAAFHLLLWLSDPQWSRQASAASPATTLFRRSHAKSARAWVEEPMPSAAAGQYAAITEQTLNRAQCLFALRIPGRAEYLAALDDAVRQTVRGELSAQAALRKAADRWRQITARYGADSQRQAYFDSLGVE